MNGSFGDDKAKLLKGQICFPEIFVTKYKPAPHNIPAEQRPELHRGGSLEPRKI